MPTVGGPDHFTLYCSQIRLSDGRLINSAWNFAGAHTTLATGVARLVGRIGLNAESALHMAVTVPAQFIGTTEAAQLIGRSLNDLIWLDQDLECHGNVSAFR